jgi:hypothetical protein
LEQRSVKPKSFSLSNTLVSNLALAKKRSLLGRGSSFGTLKL